MKRHTYLINKNTIQEGPMKARALFIKEPTQRIIIGDIDEFMKFFEKSDDKVYRKTITNWLMDYRERGSKWFVYKINENDRRSWDSLRYNYDNLEAIRDIWTTQYSSQNIECYIKGVSLWENALKELEK